MDIYGFVLAHLPEGVASLGLCMDIVGIWLLYHYGAIGGAWIDAPKDKRVWRAMRQRREKVKFEGFREVRTAEAVARNEKLARVGSRWGLGLAATGFGLQAVAQWL